MNEARELEAPAPAEAEPDDATRRLGRGLLYAVGAIQDMAWGLALFAVPFYASRKLGAGYLGLSLLAFIPTLAYTLAAFMAGRLADVVSRQRLILSGGALFAGLLLLSGWTRSLTELIAVQALGLIGLGAFWPAVQVRLGELAPPGRLSRVTGCFNVSWSVGLLLGGLAAGTIAEWLGGVRNCFLLVAGLTLVSLLLQTRFAWPRPPAAAGGDAAAAADAPAVTQHDLPADLDLRERFRRMALLANLFAVGGNATLRQFVPLLADQEGYAKFKIGLLHAAMSAAIALAFVLCTVWRGWRYRREALALSPGLLVGSALLMIYGRELPLHLLGFAACGAAYGLSYAASIFYGLNASRGTGGRAGLHEACIGLGAAVLPPLGGFAAEGLAESRLPYTVVGVAGLALLPVLFRVLRTRKRLEA